MHSLHQAVLSFLLVLLNVELLNLCTLCRSTHVLPCAPFPHPLTGVTSCGIAISDDDLRVVQARHLQLDTGIEYIRYRRKFWQLWLPKNLPLPPPSSLQDAALTPFANASILSRLTFSWATDVIVLGYQRTLQASDLCRLNPSREAGMLSEKFEVAWARRVKAAAEWNVRFERGEVHPSLLKRLNWAMQAILSKGEGRKSERNTCKVRYAILKKQWRKAKGKKEPSLALALNDVFGWFFWLGGIFKVFGDTAQLMSPLVLKAIIAFAKERSAAHAAGAPLPNVGRGIAMAFSLFFLSLARSIGVNQFFWHSMVTGVFARAALIASIYKRGVSLTGKERVTLTNAALINHISTDVSRIDACSQWFHAAWTSPIQVAVCLIILLGQLGLSALTGFSLFILIIPLQSHLMSWQRRIRLHSVMWTDQRAKVLLEALSAMRVVKYFSYEIPFLTKLFELRKKELRGLSLIQLLASVNLAFATSLPVLSAVLSFITYTSITRDFDAAIIFASLSLFQLLRQPMMFLPRALSTIADASSAFYRLSHIFHAELITGDTLVIDKTQEHAIVVQKAIFEWESFGKVDGKTIDVTFERGKGAQGKYVKRNNQSTNSPTFKVINITLTIPRGQLAVIVGPVGSGKSSLLQGIIGEMRKVSGHVSLGGKVAYCSQTAWIQNATLRDNILFGQSFDEEKYWQVVKLACLLPDLQLLPDGDLTEIGEKGINLSGGQKQRVNIARALYSNPEIVIFDDPLSAVDAHVGRYLFQDAIIGSLRNQGTTVLLVTHAIHFLPQVDYIYTMNNGMIVESGTYQELVSRDGEFARLNREYGGQNEISKGGEVEENSIVPQQTVTVEDAKRKSTLARERAAGKGKAEGLLMVKEQRQTGAISFKVYWSYLVAAHGVITVPLLVLFVVLMQMGQILSSYTLIWWEANALHRSISFYQTLYGCLGIGQAFFTFSLGANLGLMGQFVSQSLHQRAVTNVFYAPMSFFDTTPLGRILGIFGKDIDTMDNALPFSSRTFGTTLAVVTGAAIIISLLEPYFLIVVMFIAIGYSYFGTFYRASAREIKRLDAILRSLLYAHFSETFTGLSTIRSYGGMSRFIKVNRYYIDLQDRSLFLLATNQRWLAFRLDVMGSMLTLVVALLAVTDMAGISPAQIGLVLTSMITVSQMVTQMTWQMADVENNMNSVERIVQYIQDDTIPQEAPNEIPATKPPPEWPQYGAIEFKNVTMSYRPGLPNVLNGISVTIKGGEKIGVVGRTGAGKSSLMLMLYRIVEMSGGSVVLDGIDISTIGLKDLRTKISILPQDPLLFSGTIRSNLDPFDKHDDAELWHALRRSYLVDPDSAVEKDESGNGVSARRYNLDSVVESEGANLSVGERSLLSLARALVKDCKIVVLDEATASVDLETDSKIQQTIKTEFRDRTLLCIAHRLRTIISYDRVLVMDAGSVAEFDTPHNLYLHGGLFRGMCERSNITLKDIEVSRFI